MNFNPKSKESKWEQANTLNEVSTKNGSKTNIILPDGTNVWLNADSKIVYNKNFGEKYREVSLTGEAFFDVTHDAKHPFIIHTGKADIKVLGTAFNVRNYLQYKSMEATLIRGKIEVTLLDKPDEKIILHPSEKIIVSQDNSFTLDSAYKTVSENVVLTSATFTHKHDSLMVETGWIKDKLVFVNKPLEQIAGDLERKFNIQIKFSSSKAKGYRYTGYFENESAEDIMRILQLSKKINYTVNNKSITIE